MVVFLKNGWVVVVVVVVRDKPQVHHVGGKMIDQLLPKGPVCSGLAEKKGRGLTKELVTGWEAA